MPRPRIHRYTLFGLLYFTQGTILSYFTALNALYFLSQGLTMTSVGIFASIALIPFVVKIFLGMLSDRFNLFGMGYRKPYILLGLAIQFICLILAPFIDLRTGYWSFVALAFILQMGMALYDTCTDGLALDTTPIEEQGTIQGFMVGGRAVGVIVTASVVGLLAERATWFAVFWLLAGLTLLPLPLVLRMKEPERPAHRRFDWHAFRAFKQPSVWLVAAVGLVSFLVMVGANQLINPFIQQTLQTGLSTAGFLTTFWGIGVVAGGVVGGRMSGKIGLEKGIWLGLSLVTVSLLMISRLVGSTSGMPVIFVLVIFFGLAYGVYQTTIFALAMRHTEAAIAASMFAILMAFINVGQGVGLGVGGVLVDRLGYPTTIAGFALINLLVIPLMLFLWRRSRLANNPALSQG